MSAASSKSSRKTSKASPKSTSSPASEAGVTPSDPPAGQTMSLFGPDHVPAHHSRPQGKKGVRSAKRITARQHDYNFSGMVTSLGAQAALTGILDIFGRKCGDSSRSVDLQRSLVNRLRVRTDALGSTLFNLTWKLQTTPSHRSICALLASGRLTSDSDFSSWPTPMAGTKGTEEYNEAGSTDSSRRTVALLTSWSTPNVDDANNATRESGQFKSLTRDAQLTSWATPPDGSKRERVDQLPRQVQLSTWSSPRATDAKAGSEYSEKMDGKSLQMDAHQVQQTVIGYTPSGSPAKTAATARLNPKFSLWLMGLPVIVWASCGERVMRSSRRSRKLS